jgi:hypothetical protein
LGQYSRFLALAYFTIALHMCRVAGLEPSLLLHPLDFLGCEDDADLSFFPAMKLPRKRKLDLLRHATATYCRMYDVVPLREHARRVADRKSQPEAVT